MQRRETATMRRTWYALLVLPFLGTLVPPFYNRMAPALLGMPFFYWYQLLWILVTAAIVGTIVLLSRERNG